VKRLALVWLALAGGCYPWVGGRWDDYWVPDEVQLVGVATHVERVGGYWGDPSPTGDAWIGWLQQPRAGTSAMELFAPDGPGCARGELDESAVTDQLGDPGAEQAWLRGPRDYELTWDTTDQRFEGAIDDIPAGSWDLELHDSERAGVLDVVGLLSMPKAVAISGPDLGGMEIASGTLDDLAFAWTPSTVEADWVYNEARIADLGSSGYQSFEWVRCLGAPEEGELVISSALWNDTGRAEVVYVFPGVLDESFERVTGRDFSASVVGLRRELGMLHLE